MNIEAFRQGRLGEFDIDRERGFLPAPDPLRRLPRAFDIWEQAAADLPKLLVSVHCRRVLADLPPFPLDRLSSDEEFRRAMVIFSYLGHAYVWAQGETIESLPRSIAVPWHGIAKKLGRPPVLSYASYALDNWRRIDPAGPVDADNVALLNNFLGGIDEEWFVVIHVDIEAKAGLAVSACPEAALASVEGDGERLKEALSNVHGSLVQMNQVMDRMTESCDPYIYFNRVRPYIHGWKDHPLLPNGLKYEGVDEFAGQPQRYRGETGAQSGIVPCLDALLGIDHRDDPLRPYLNEMRYYMPPAHRVFLELLEQTSQVRAFVRKEQKQNPELREVYNGCVQELTDFRSRHLRYASAYIDSQSQRDKANPSKVGTGGTPFMAYLTKHRDETGDHLL